MTTMETELHRDWLETALHRDWLETELHRDWLETTELPRWRTSCRTLWKPFALEVKCFSELL